MELPRLPGSHLTKVAGTHHMAGRSLQYDYDARHQFLFMDSSMTLRDGHVTGRTTQGTDIQGNLLHVSHYEAVAELFDLSATLQISEVLDDFEILFDDKVVYRGRGIIKNLINTGLATHCVVTLEEGWINLELEESTQADEIGIQYQSFVKSWRENYQIDPEYKVAVADIQTYLVQLRSWLEKLELTLTANSDPESATRQRHALLTLEKVCLPDLQILFENFERISKNIPSSQQSTHARYVKWQLHPLVLCSPFMFRTFQKPLGYAGDFEMVRMMTDDRFQGGSMFAKLLNSYFLDTHPVAAHRNRLSYLKDLLIQETALAKAHGHTFKVYNLGCGPVVEIQNYLEDSVTNQEVEFTLLDFNKDTLAYAQQALSDRIARTNRKVHLKLVKKSVSQLIKDSFHQPPSNKENGYDLTYCAGLFDYLSDQVCQKLILLMYRLTKPGGLIVVTNVDAYNPNQNWMEYSVDWHLIYRNQQSILALLPDEIPSDAVSVKADLTGVNHLLQIRKPADG